MPLTRFSYPYSYDTIFLPTVTANNNLSVSGSTSVVGSLTVGGITTLSGNTTVAGSLTINGSTILSSLFATTANISNQIVVTNTNQSSRSVNTFQSTNGSVFSIRNHGPSYVETLFGNTMANNTLLTSTAGDLIVGAFGNNNLIFGTDNSQRVIINNSGQVGIGPIVSGTFNRGLSINSEAGATAGILFVNNSTGTTSSDGSALYITSSDFIINNREAATVQIHTSNAERINVGSSGTVEFKGGGTSSLLFGTDSGGSISLGRRDNNATSPYLDFNSGATTVDYDTRIQASGGTGTVGKGAFSIESGQLYLRSGLIEPVVVSATAATGTINYDVLTNRNVLYYNANASANWTLNVRGSSTVTLNSILSVGESITVVFMATNGTTAYYATGFQVDGTATTVRWQGGTTPTSGNASSTDVYSYTIVKTAATPTYFVLGTQTRFA